MKEQLIKSAKEKRFESFIEFAAYLVPFKSSKEITDFEDLKYYLWMCELQKWLREEHGFEVWLKPINDDKWSCYVDNFPIHLITKYLIENSYEESLEKGLIEALKLIKQ